MDLQCFCGVPLLDIKAKLVNLGLASQCSPCPWLAQGWECDLVQPEKEKILGLPWELTQKTIQLDFQLKE